MLGYKYSVFFVIISLFANIFTEIFKSPSSLPSPIFTPPKARLGLLKRRFVMLIGPFTDAKHHFIPLMPETGSNLPPTAASENRLGQKINVKIVMFLFGDSRYYGYLCSISTFAAQT